VALTERRFDDFATPIRFDVEEIIVDVRGELDAATAPSLQDVLDHLIAEGARRIVVDMAEASFVDSTGLGALLTAHLRMRAHRGELVLSNPRPAARRLLELTALDRVFTLQ
jgi:anti-sigma B factor antagonist